MGFEPARKRDGYFLVAVRDLLVAVDISQTISEHWPTADVFTATSLSHAEEILARTGGLVRLAVLDAPRAELLGSRAWTLLREYGVRIVFLGDRKPDAPDGTYLSQPFTTNALHEALRRGDRCADLY